MTVQIISVDGYQTTLKEISSSSGGISARTILAEVVWPDGERRETYVKIFKPQDRYKEIINESLGYLLANQVSLKQAPNAALIKISIQDIPAEPTDTYASSNGYYYAWASVSVGGSNMRKLHFKPPYQNITHTQVSSYFSALGEWDNFPCLIVFDDWIGNSDRNAGNIVFLKKNDIAIIDHGRLFGVIDWTTQGIDPNMVFSNLMWDHFQQIHAGTPSTIACTQIINYATQHQSIFATYSQQLKSDISIVFQEFLNCKRTIDETLSRMVDYFEHRLAGNVQRFTPSTKSALRVLP